MRRSNRELRAAPAFLLHPLPARVPESSTFRPSWSRSWWSFQCLHDHANVVAYHSDVGPFGSSGGAHRVGEKLSADLHVPSFGAGPLDYRFDRSRRDAGLDEHRLHLAGG